MRKCSINTSNWRVNVQSINSAAIRKESGNSSQRSCILRSRLDGSIQQIRDVRLQAGFEHQAIMGRRHARTQSRLEVGVQDLV